MRISSIALLALSLAACDSPRSDPAKPVQPDHRDAEDRIDCVRAGATAFARECTVDRSAGTAGPILTVRHPDGAFHRLLVTGDGRGVIAADGAERAVVTVIGDGEIEVALGGDRYRLPATVKGAKPGP